MMRLSASSTGISSADRCRDGQWVRAAITMFRPSFPSEIRLFRLAELGAARDWISRVEKVNGGRIAALRAPDRNPWLGR
jgi:hypothetical protein